MLPKKSKMMDALYGEPTSKEVYDRCQSLSPKFNDLVQNVVYDIFWARSGLLLKEKSLVTIITLITLNKEEQLKIHLKGFLNLKGTSHTIIDILDYMIKNNYIKASKRIDKIKQELSAKDGKPIANTDIESSNKGSLSNRTQAIVDLVAHIALADAIKLKQLLKTLQENRTLSEEDIENIMLHEMIYSGFPCAMNGFAILKILNDAKNMAHETTIAI